MCSYIYDPAVGDLNAARENNQKHAEWTSDRKRRTELLAAADKLVAESEALTLSIDKRQSDKQSAIASAKLLTGIMAVTGPNISSWAMRILGFTSANMVGSWKQPLSKPFDSTILPP